MSLPAYPQCENGDAYIYARQLVSLVLELIKVRLGFGFDIVRVTSSMRDRYG